VCRAVRGALEASRVTATGGATERETRLFATLPAMCIEPLYGDLLGERVTRGVGLCSTDR
jgi:hypothetical protein